MSFRGVVKIAAKAVVKVVKKFESHPVALEILCSELSNAKLACVHGVRKSTSANVANFKNLDKSFLKDKPSNFEDLSFLFDCSYANRGIIAQDFDEAAYIFKVIRSRGESIKQVLEIGRFLGGSTLLMSVAKTEDAKLVSVDLKVKTPDFADDKVIREIIDLANCKNVELVISDSRAYKPKDKLDFIFIDGDHSYEGVKADYNHYEKYLNPGCEVFFHDAVASREFSTKDNNVYTFVNELAQNKNLELVKDVGSIRHFKYIGE